MVVPVEVVTIAAQNLCTGNHLTVTREECVRRLVEDVQIEAVADQVVHGIFPCGCISSSQTCLCVCYVLCSATWVVDDINGSHCGSNTPGVVYIHPLRLHEVFHTQTVILGNTTAVSTLLDVKAYVQTSLLSLLRGNQDDTVRCAVTIKRSRSSVLQYRHRLDVGGVQVRDVATERHTVDDIQRAG